MYTHMYRVVLVGVICLHPVQYCTHLRAWLLLALLFAPAPVVDDSVDATSVPIGGYNQNIITPIKPQ